MSNTSSVASVVENYHQLMRALHVERARRGIDPWYDCAMSRTQLRALSLIASSPHGLSSGELAEILAVGASAITPLVDRLVERGFAHRTADPHDRRIVRVEATTSGNALLENLSAGQGDIVREIVSQLSAEDLATVATAFHVLYTTLTRTPTRPTPTRHTLLSAKGITA